MGELNFETPLGECSLGWDGERLTRVRLPELMIRRREGMGAGVAETEEQITPPAWVSRLATRVRAHLGGDLQDFADVLLDVERVSDFQRSVYFATIAVRPGSTSTYGAIARELGLGPEAARAVGVALGRNPWPLIVPCHRIVSTSGKLTGFSAPGGVTLKARLLAIEGAELALE